MNGGALSLLWGSGRRLALLFGSLSLLDCILAIILLAVSNHRSNGENNPSRGRRTQDRATDRSQLKTIRKSDRREAEKNMQIALDRLKNKN